MSHVAGFKAVDAEGNELGVVSMSELTASISEQVLQTIAMRNQANTLEQPALMSTLATGNDAYENELQQVSDANWVRALLADGTPVLWNKSDLASVVGGLLSYPFDQRGVIQNFNNTIKSGMYLIADQSHNVPGKPGNITYGFAIIGNVPRSSSEVYYLQLVFDFFNGMNMYIRSGTVNPNSIDLSLAKWGKITPVIE